MVCKKVLFIIHDVYQEDNSFPAGIAYLATILKNNGVEVSICCQDVFHYSNDGLIEMYLKKESYDLICLGFLAARFKETVKGLCEAITKNKKDAWLVLGGHGASAIPEYMLEQTKADIVAIGEAEETIVEIIDCKAAGGVGIEKIKGIAYRVGEQNFVNPRRTPVKDLDSLPVPDYELFPMDHYTNCYQFKGMGKNDKALSFGTGRGCVNRCTFCYRLERGIRFRKVVNVVDEMEMLNKKYGVAYFNLNDELFVASKKRLKEFRDVLRERGLKIKYDCNARVDIFDEEIVEYLKDSGCLWVNFGMESSDQKVLDLMNKNTTVEQNINGLELAKSSGLWVGLNFMWGCVGDTESSLRGNVALIKKYNTYYHLRTIRPVTPYPGCDLYYYAIKKGLLKGPADFFDKFKNSDLLTVDFMDIPDAEVYRLLFDVNKELIIDHYENTSKDMDEANSIIESFRQLYFEKNYSFRGSRSYEKTE